MPGCAVAGVFGMLPEALAMCDNWRQQAPPQVLTALQRKGLRAQRSIAGDLIFGSLYQDKEQSPPAAIERDNAHDKMLPVQRLRRSYLARNDVAEILRTY